MNDELTEGANLGVTLIISVAILLFMSLLCGIARGAYISREKTVAWQNEISKQHDWKELTVYEAYENVAGAAENTVYTTIDNMCQWIIMHDNEYQVIIINQNDMMSPGYIDQSKVNNNKWKAQWAADISSFDTKPTTVLYNCASQDIVDYIYDQNIARGLLGQSELQKAYITVYSSINYFYEWPDQTVIENAWYPVRKTFDEYYALEPNSVIIFQLK